MHLNISTVQTLTVDVDTLMKFARHAVPNILSAPIVGVRTVDGSLDTNFHSEFPSEIQDTVCVPLFLQSRYTVPLLIARYRASA